MFLVKGEFINANNCPENFRNDCRDLHFEQTSKLKPISSPETKEMLEENESPSPTDIELKKSEQNYIHSLQLDKNSNNNEEIDQNECDRDFSNIDISKEESNNDNNSERKIEECLKDEEILTKEYSSMKYTQVTDLFQTIIELDNQSIRDTLSNVAEHELSEILEEIESTNHYLLKENKVYEFILNDDETLQSFLGRLEEVDSDTSTLESFQLTYPAKCYFAKKNLEYTQKALKQKIDDHAFELQNLNFELESLNKSLKDLKDSEEKFHKNVRIDGRHPVTKKIILQKVAKYFNDSIRAKMDLANRYKIQIQSDIMEQNKILSQIKAQEKRLAFLDMTEFLEAQFEHKKSCRELVMYKVQLGKYKAKCSFLLQKIAKLKRDLEKEESDMEQMKNAVIKLEHLKEVMLSEKARNDEKVLDLKVSMRKIRLDPRRHNLPEVIDYAAAKRENVALMKNVNKWKNKVETIQQEKLLHLNALSKKKKY